jgi:hypothetical protein
MSDPDQVFILSPDPISSATDKHDGNTVRTVSLRIYETIFENVLVVNQGPEDN